MVHYKMFYLILCVQYFALVMQMLKFQNISRRNYGFDFYRALAVVKVLKACEVRKCVSISMPTLFG